MKIAVVGRGNVGGGLADLWEGAGHELQRIGQDGGDVSEAEAVVVAVPGGAIAEALANVRGVEGKTVIDSTNRVGVEPPEGFASNAEYMKSKTNGPTAKSFNINFASLYSRIGEASTRPSNMWCGDDEARQVVERLNRDAGCRLRAGLRGPFGERLCSGGLHQARLRDRPGWDGAVRVSYGAPRSALIPR
jgi:8-hydroxy-5-deazaflavin:NADPH oxidoreductase